MKFTEYKDQWALILGASSGFGAAAARELSKAGLNIFGVHLDRKATMPQVEILQNDIRTNGQDCHFFNINAADSEKRLECLKEIKKIASGKIKIMMHSLAFGTLKPFINDSEQGALSDPQMAMTLDVMASSLAYWARDAHTEGLFSPGAKIYAMTSTGSSRVWKSYGAVSAAKAALESNCRQLAYELAPHGVCVNAILAGVTDTAALRKIPGNEQMILSAQKRNPMGRLTLPEDVAKAMVALSLDYCNFMTGNTIRIDGGENITE